MGLGFSLSKAPFEDPLLASRIDEFSWESPLDRLNEIASERGYARYRETVDDLSLRSEIHSTALKREAVEIARRYLENGNGQISELDALELVSHIARARQYFQPTPQEEARDRTIRTRYDEDEEAATSWEKLGEIKARAFRETIRDLKEGYYIGDIRMHS